MTTTRSHWSFSSLSQYMRCPLQYFFARILRLPQPVTSSALALGSAVHEALAEYHHSIQVGKPMQREAVLAAFHTAWQSRRTRETIRFRAGEGEAGIVEQGVALIEAYLREPPPENIVAVEHEMVAPLRTSGGDYLEKPLVAVADLIVREHGGLVVQDLKTSGHAYSELEADTSLQATCYASAASDTLGELPRFEYTVLVKTRTPRVQRITTNRTPLDLVRLGDLVQTIDRAVEAGAYYPVESPVNCSSCPFRGPCREWTAETMSAMACNGGHADRERR